jgi:purine nucleoside permease
MRDGSIAGHPIDVSLRATIESLKQLSKVSEVHVYRVHVLPTASNYHNDNDDDDGGQSTTRQCKGTLL